MRYHALPQSDLVLCFGLVFTFLAQLDSEFVIVYGLVVCFNFSCGF